MNRAMIVPYQWWAQEHSCQAQEFGDTDPFSQLAMPLPEDDGGDDDEDDEAPYGNHDLDDQWS